MPLSDAPDTRSPAEALRGLISGYRVSQLIYVAAKLAIADHLADGPRSVDQLARSVSVHPGALYRVLRALASYGVFAERGRGVFELTPRAEPLRSDTPGSVRGYAIMNGEEWFWSSWGELLHSVKTGRTAFDDSFGIGLFGFLDQHPEAAEIFNDAMTSITGMDSDAIAAAYDFSRKATIVDVGGGRGSLMTAILRAHPHATGILFDRPPVLAGVSAALAAKGLTDRCAVMAGDFFDSVPHGGDVYILKDIVHDWPDDRAVAVLKNCRRAMREEARLLVIERVIPAGNEPSFAKLADVNMLVITGGLERTEAEYRTLLTASGFRLSRVVPTRSPSSIVEGVPVNP